MDNDDVIDVLNDLIEISKDGQYGFSTSAERVQSPQLRETLQRRAQDCERAASELQSLVVQCGGKPADRGTALGAMHRGWVSVKDVVGTSVRSVLEECERGEDTAVARYRKALKQDLPESIRQVVQRQADGAQRNHDQIKSLRDAATV
jgi:uncharacterized protein (TIGR02284 family)